MSDIVNIVNNFFQALIEGSVSAKIQKGLMENLMADENQTELKTQVETAVQTIVDQAVTAAVAAVPKTKAPVTHRLKDPSAPAAKKSAYMFFSTNKEVRQQAVEHLTDAETGTKAKLPEVSAFLGAQWKNLSPEEKAPWEEMAKEDAARFASESQGYVRPSDEELKALPVNNKKPRGRSPSPSPRAKKAADAPKNARSAYILFGLENRAAIKEANPQAGPKEMLSLIGSAWANADEETKALYTQQAEEDKARYQSELEAWKAAHPGQSVAPSRAASPAPSRAASPAPSPRAAPALPKAAVPTLTKPTLPTLAKPAAAPAKPTLPTPAKPAAAPAKPTPPTLTKPALPTLTKPQSPVKTVAVEEEAAPLAQAKPKVTKTVKVTTQPDATPAVAVKPSKAKTIRLGEEEFAAESE